MQPFWITISLGLPIFLFMIGFIVQLRIPKSAADKLFPFQRFENNGRVYEFIGVKAFKIFLNRSGYNALMQKEMKLRTRQRDFERLIFLTQQAELIHLVGFFLSFIVSFIFLRVNMQHQFCLMTIANILFNLYPVFLQRYNRLRLRKFSE